MRAAAAEQARERSVEIAVGGSFGQHLLISYRVVDVDELDRFASLGGKIGEASLSIEMMVSTAKTVLWRDDHGVATDLGVGLSPKLWELMGWALPDGIDNVDELTPREVVIKLFGGNGAALGRHLEQLAEWLQDPGGPSPGESSAAT